MIDLFLVLLALVAIRMLLAGEDIDSKSLSTRELFIKNVVAISQGRLVFVLVGIFTGLYLVCYSVIPFILNSLSPGLGYSVYLFIIHDDTQIAYSMVSTSFILFQSLNMRVRVYEPAAKYAFKILRL